MTSLDDSASLALADAAATPAAWTSAVLDRGARIARPATWAVCLIVAAAAALRFAELDDVPGNLFYDAAVRSMSLSWHNFFFGAFDPSGFLSVDKAPFDLWLQVISVKLFGWNTEALRLPEALGGTLAVPLLYDTVRRVAGKAAGLGAAMTLAVLPVSVLTSRSDTMDSVMMLLVIAAMWLTVRAIESGRRRWFVLAGAALGLAFNVKLFEALIPAPAIFALYAAGAGVAWRRRILGLLGGGVALVGVGLSWAIVASVAPGYHPWPVGSTDGTVWNVMFVFNGFGRVSSNASAAVPGGPSPTRLLESNAWHFDLLFGYVLLAAVILAVAAAIPALVERLRNRGVPYPIGLDAAEESRPPVALAMTVSLAVWVIAAYVVFSHVAIMHTRYLEAMSPAVAAVVGIAAASLAGLCTWRRPGALPAVVCTSAGLAAVCVYAFSTQPKSLAWGAVALAIAAAGAAMIGTSGGRMGYLSQWLTAGLIVATTAVFPVHESVRLVHIRSNNSAGLRTYPLAYEARLWNYLGPRTAGTRYELAVDEPLALAPLIIHDERPIVPLTSFKGIGDGVSVATLATAVRSGEVRYALIGKHRCQGAHDNAASCAPASLWIRSHGIDVTAAAGLDRGNALYELLPNL